MHTHSKSYPFNSTATIPRRSNQRRVPNIVEPEICTIEEYVLMADRTMKELLQTPTEGYGEAIVIPKILVENFEIKTNLLQLVQANKFHSLESENPHTHISNFKRMTLTLKYRDVPNDAIKLMLFPCSLEDKARVWYEKEPPNSILTWDDLELTQIDTFYNGLHEQDQDSLNAAAGGNLLNKTNREALKIIENKSKLRLLISKFTLATTKAVEKTCVTCGGAHAYYDCIATDSNQPSVCAATGSYNQSNNVPNPKGKMKVVTTRNGLAYEGPSIPTNSPLEKVVEQDTEETTDKEHSNCQGSIAQVQPSVVPISIPEPDVLRTQPKPTILYPSRLNDQKLQEIKDFLNDESIPTGIDNSLYDPERDILYLEKLLNEDPFKFPLMDLKQAEETKEKSSIEEPPKLELKELPSHLEYAFLEESDKLLVIIAKDLKDVEKEALIKVLKSHKRAIAWKIFDIKGIHPRFCTHKILMEEHYKPVVQSQRRVNPKIHDVIKKEVIKLLDAGIVP
nr:reverse transcriptase domain-containing protein [Tanacetum cinerariifolium]